MADEEVPIIIPEGEEEGGLNEEGEEDEDEENDEGEEGEEGGEGKEDKDGLAELKSRLDSIRVESPKLAEPIFDPEKFPPSYKDNNKKEDWALWLCKEALRQFRIVYFDRRPLFLKPLNEFGVKKVVCTTIKPSQMKYTDLYNWEEISVFLAGYLDYTPLKPPHMLPNTLYAPQTVLDRKRGHTFEYSTLLCSMLIASGYDAYVISGHASHEVAALDLRYTPCPIMELDQKTFTKPLTVTVCKYTARPPRALKSEYLLRMRKKDLVQKQRLADEKIRAEDHARALDEAPPSDPIRSWHVHSWVLVLPGQRDIKDPFFIEPTTGTYHATDWGEYLGIESIWNHLNYYINVHREVVNPKVPVIKLMVPRPFLFPIAKMSWDIGNSCHWDYIFHWQDLHRDKDGMERKMESESKGDPLEERFFDLPRSWTTKLTIARDDYLLKYPTGKKSTKYKSSYLEQYAEYLQPDGMTQKLWVYTGVDCEYLHYSKETFKHRSDQLVTRYFEQDTGRIIEFFKEGRLDFLKEHHYYGHSPGPHSKRTVVFDQGKRTEELYKKEEGPDFIRLHFGYRVDRLYRKEIRFGPDGFVREDPKLIGPEARPIESIQECYRRNPDLNADEDIHRLFFSVISDDIDIDYHVADHRIVGSTRHFTKPANWWDETQVLAWKPELHWSFDIDPYVRPKYELTLFLMLIKNMFHEASTRDRTRLTERETVSFLKTRTKEEANIILVKGYILANQDEVYRRDRLSKKAAEKAARILAKSDILRDYLEPNIKRLGLDMVVTNKKQAQRAKEECLADLKDRLLTQANEMKEQFEKEKKAIVSKQIWYHENFIKLSRDDEEQFRSDIMQHMFVAHILEQRIGHHKEYAPVKYQALIDTLSRDPRLMPFLY